MPVPVWPNEQDLVFAETELGGGALDELVTLAFVEQVDLVDDRDALDGRPTDRRCSFSSSVETPTRRQHVDDDVLTREHTELEHVFERELGCPTPACR